MTSGSRVKLPSGSAFLSMEDDATDSPSCKDGSKSLSLASVGSGASTKNTSGLSNWRYEGEFLNGKKHGQGRIFYPDGCTYEVTFVMDEQCGKGSYFGKSGKLLATGPWKNGKLEKEVRLTGEE